MASQLITVSIITSAGGAFAATTPIVDGEIMQYRYVPDGTSPLDTGADLDIAGAVTGVVIANQDNIGTSAFTRSPRTPTQDTTGAASLHAAGGEPVEDRIFVTGEGLLVTIAEGGNAKAGTLYIAVR
jgi:hypothetical protein